MQVGILYKIINFFLDARLKLGIITFAQSLEWSSRFRPGFRGNVHP